MMRNALLFRETTISKQKKSAMTKYRTLSEKKATVDDRNPTANKQLAAPSVPVPYGFTTPSLPQLWVRPGFQVAADAVCRAARRATSEALLPGSAVALSSFGKPRSPLPGLGFGFGFGFGLGFGFGFGLAHR